MNIKSVFLIFSLFLCFETVALAEQPRKIQDATGTSVALPIIPKRIVTLAPSLGEIAADLLGKDLDRIVGVTDYSTYPPALKKVPSVGSYVQLNLEKIISLKPDLVLGTLDGNPKDRIKQLRELGIPVVIVGTSSLAEIQDSILLVANTLGVPESGQKMTGQIKRGLENIRKRAEKRPHPKVMLQLGDAPLVVVGKGTFLHDALESIGAKNLYGDSSTHYPRPSVEDVLSRNPDMIVVMDMTEDRKTSQLMLRKWSELPALKAVQTRKIRLLRSDALVRPTLRILEGLSLLERVVFEEFQ